MCGDWADMVLDGVLCERCGQAIDEDSEACGFPTVCSACQDKEEKETKNEDVG